MPMNERIWKFLRTLFRSAPQVEAAAATANPGDAPPLPDAVAPAPDAMVATEPPPPAIPPAPADPPAPPAPAPAPEADARGPQGDDRLPRLPQALQEVAEAIRAQAGVNERFQEVLAGLAEPNQDLIHAMQDLAGESQKQTDLLQAVSRGLAERRQVDNQTDDAVARLPDLLDGLQRSNASLVTIMEQVRDRWAAARDDLAGELLRQGRRTHVCLLVLIGLAAVGVLWLIGMGVRGFLGG